MRTVSSPTFRIVFLLFVLFTSACARHPVRHLASDISLLSPGSTTKEEVVSYFGPPDSKKQDNNGEIWLYYEPHRDFMGKLPYVGKKMGTVEYDVTSIAFEGDVVKGGKYRILSEKEFNELEIKTGGDAK